MVIEIAFLLLTSASSKGSELPPEAKITVGRPTPTPGASDKDKALCKMFHLNPGQVRRRFRTYHRITGIQHHHEYLDLSCTIQGSLTYKGRVYHWETTEGNLLWTNWPSGKDILLGGEPSITEDMQRSK